MFLTPFSPRGPFFCAHWPVWPPLQGTEQVWLTAGDRAKRSLSSSQTRDYRTVGEPFPGSQTTLVSPVALFTRAADKVHRCHPRLCLCGVFIVVLYMYVKIQSCNSYVYNPVTLNTFTMLCNHYHYVIFWAKLFHLPQLKLCTY